MYIDTQAIIKAAELIGAAGVIIGLIVGIYKIVAQSRAQGKQIEIILKEQTVIVYALKGALEGLVESGCNGPCKEALAALNKHINKQAHGQE